MRTEPWWELCLPLAQSLSLASTPRCLFKDYLTMWFFSLHKAVLGDSGFPVLAPGQLVCVPYTSLLITHTPPLSRWPFTATNGGLPAPELSHMLFLFLKHARCLINSYSNLGLFPEASLTISLPFHRSIPTLFPPLPPLCFSFTFVLFLKTCTVFSCFCFDICPPSLNGQLPKCTECACLIHWWINSPVSDTWQVLKNHLLNEWIRWSFLERVLHFLCLSRPSVQHRNWQSSGQCPANLC